MAALLLVPLAAPTEHHVVRPGETLGAIAANYGVQASDLAEANALADGVSLVVGRVIIIPSASTGEHVARVVSVAGEAFVRGPGVPPQRLVTGAIVAPGHTVCTEVLGFATLRLPSAMAGGQHDEVSLAAETCLVLEAAHARGTRRSALINVSQGGVAVRSSMGNPGTVTVRTESGVTSAVDGGFRVTNEEGVAARTEALYGEVALFGGGAVLDMAAGYGSRTRRGAPPDTPTPLPPAGTPVAPGPFVAMVRAQFSWTPVDRALAYQVELAAADDFSAVVVMEESASPGWTPELLLLPYRVPGLWWRVSSVDRSGFVGIPSDPLQILLPAGVGP